MFLGNICHYTCQWDGWMDTRSPLLTTTVVGGFREQCLLEDPCLLRGEVERTASRPQRESRSCCQGLASGGMGLQWKVLCTLCVPISPTDSGGGHHLLSGEENEWVIGYFF